MKIDNIISLDEFADICNSHAHCIDCPLKDDVYGGCLLSGIPCMWDISKIGKKINEYYKERTDGNQTL